MTTEVMMPTASPPMGNKRLQVNFKCTEVIAYTIAKAAAAAGSTRRYFALLVQQAGYPVPDADLAGPKPRAGRSR